MWPLPLTHCSKYFSKNKTQSTFLKTTLLKKLLTHACFESMCSRFLGVEATLRRRSTCPPSMKGWQPPLVKVSHQYYFYLFFFSFLLLFFFYVLKTLFGFLLFKNIFQFTIRIFFCGVDPIVNNFSNVA